MNSFDSKAKDWDLNPSRVERARTAGQRILETLPISKEMCGLELGCGTGLLSFELQPFLEKIVLADSSDEMLKELKKKIVAKKVSNLFPLKYRIEKDPLPRERFHLVYSLMTLHHIQDTDQVLKICFSLLKDPGYLCIVDLEKEDGSFHGSGFSGHNGFDQEELTNKLGKAGFQNIRFSTIYQMKKERTKTYPLFLMIAEKKML